MKPFTHFSQTCFTISSNNNFFVHVLHSENCSKKLKYSKLNMYFFKYCNQHRDYFWCWYREIIHMNNKKLIKTFLNIGTNLLFTSLNFFETV